MTRYVLPAVAAFVLGALLLTWDSIGGPAEAGRWGEVVIAGGMLLASMAWVAHRDQRQAQDRERAYRLGVIDTESAHRYGGWTDGTVTVLDPTRHGS